VARQSRNDRRIAAVVVQFVPGPRGHESRDRQAILRVGGRDGARKVLELGEGDQRVLAVRVLGQDTATTLSDLTDLLYSPVDTIRIAALEQLVKRSDHAQLLSLLDEYPRARDTYYYNVVCELDWLMFALNSAIGELVNDSEAGA
jgi:hypothetical protein